MSVVEEQVTSRTVSIRSFSGGSRTGGAVCGRVLFDRVHEAAKSNAPTPHFLCSVRGVEASTQESKR